MKSKQCILTKLEPDVKTIHSTGTNTWSIPIKLLCCRLLKSICRLQAESDRKLPCVSPRVQASTALLSPDSETSWSRRWEGQGKCLWEAFVTKLSRDLGGSHSTPPTDSSCVSVQSQTPTPPTERTHLWSKTETNNTQKSSHLEYLRNKVFTKC